MGEISDMMQDALDVIKLLKAENFHQNERIEQLEAENERLKEALGVYADESNWCKSDRNCYKSVLYIAELLCDDDFNGYEIAQEALKGNE